MRRRDTAASRRARRQKLSQIAQASRRGVEVEVSPSREYWQCKLPRPAVSLWKQHSVLHPL